MPASFALPLSSGLFTGPDAVTPVSLVGISVEAEITGLCARVSVAHRYVNRETTPIEAVYVFPLDEGAAVCGFEAVVDDVVIAGEVRERDEAFEHYDHAFERGDGAFLLDEHRPDVFQASIGNLRPGGAVLVRITYVTELISDDGRARFTLPLTIAPKYAPDDDHRGIGQPDAEALNPPVAWSVPYGMDLTVSLDMGVPITEVSSPSHPVAVSWQDQRTVVRLSHETPSLDRDFILTIDAASLRQPTAWVERDGETTSIAVGFIPEFDATPMSAEIVFLVDRSGSMEGDSIEQVRNALQICLRSMRAGCAFNIVGFGDDYRMLYERSRPYDEVSLDDASWHVKRLDADLGGTELKPALDFVLGQPSFSGLPRRVLVLTDGEVTNTDRIIQLAAAHRGTTRIFTLGIGSGASQHLVRGLARAGGGAAEFIHPGERIESRVLRQFARLLAPTMGDVRVEWVDGDAVTVPAEAPPVFAGQRYLLYGTTTGRVPTAARITASFADGPRSWQVPLADASRVGPVTTLTARARIRDIEESGAWLAQRGSRQHDRKTSTVRQQVIAIATRHRLLSRDTSFVAVERRSTPVHGDIQLRRVPLKLAHGWGGTSHEFRRAMLLDEGSAFEWDGLPVRPMRAEDFESLFGAAPTAQARSAPRDASPIEGMAVRRSVRPGILSRLFGGSKARTFDPLVALQAADGSWSLSREFAAAIGKKLKTLEYERPDAEGDVSRSWATALALVWLELFAARAEQEWRMLADKAAAWLKQQPLPPGDDWLHLARRVLSR
ncbi:MAG TPA: VIT domain-containing protein [Luteitalea sp.]|nr:VIT domain-containing protein [Luteitalea sp.]